MARHQGVRVVLAVALAFGLALGASLRAQSQTASGTGQSSSAPRANVAAPRATSPTPQRTQDGRPDLQGTWDFAQLTPFEKPSEFADKTALSDEEAEEFAQSRVTRDNKDKRDGGAAADVERAYNDFWWDFGTRIAKQPSLVVDPADGRLPALTAEAQKRVAERRNRYDNPEERPLAERCILGFNSGPPMVPSAYNNNMQLVQTKDYVLIYNEMVHSARVIDLTGKPHPPASMKYLTGHSIGHWEGKTLVVDTTNFQRDGLFRNSTASMHLVERFTRESPDVLRYEFTMNDPAVWTKPFTASIPMRLSDQQIFEYACHEANYGLEGVLKGARFQDKSAAK
jgi:hypothetical protein